MITLSTASLSRCILATAAALALIILPACGKKDPLDDLKAKHQAEMEAELAAGGIDPVKQAERDRLLKIELQKAMGASGDAAEPAKVLMRLMNDMQAEQAAYNQRIEGLEKSTILDPDSLKTAAGLDKADAEIKWLIAESKRMQDVIKQLPSKMEKAMRDEGVSEAEFPAARKAAKVDVAVPILLKIRSSDTRIWQAWATRLTLMRAELGKWKVDPTSHSIEFERDAANDEFNATANEIDAATNDQLEAQKQLVAMQKE